ncbi:hypothetical protein IC229_16470 [Spirosoma sp. BT702]|uniref:Uncharacterized protein n=1 Tax=Spirosoma profusum TaxID=2771354 RepID=A0A926XX58_9BACT|nr:hypothetical protein [Spirosoma profusum]MBD2702249.1 hypothetical protein [Spirosoma profusum]
MSVSSNSRKESTESYAAQGMHSTMGTPPELSQLNDKNLENELPSRVADSNDTDVPGDVAKIDAENNVESEDDEADRRRIEEAKRASWGQSSVSEDDTTNVTETDWSQEGGTENVPATRANEPERTLGNA